MANVAWGIDIGNRALKAVKLQRSADGLKIVDFAFIEHDSILSESGDNRQSLVQTALAKFVGRHDTRKTPICIGVSGQQSFARFVKLPPVEPKKVPEIVKFEAVQQIPFPLDEVEWSYQLFQKPDDQDIEVGIFAIRKELVNERVGTFLEVDLDVHAVQTSPLADFNAMRFDGRLDKGHSIIVDLGADSTDLVIADAESIWMRTLDIGGNNFTEALAKSFKIDFDKAEEMKRNAKTSKYAKQIYQAMRPVFGELVSEIQRSLGFFSSGHRDVQLRKVIALGGGFKLNGLSGYVQKNLQMAVEKPTKFSALPPDEPAAASALSEHILSGATAYGLALQLVDEGKVTSSLLPMAIRKEKLWKDKTKWFAAAAALVVGGALVGVAGYMYNSMALQRASADANDVDRLITDAQGLDSQWTAVTSDGAPQLEQVKNVNLLVSDRGYWPRILEEIDRVLPAPPQELSAALRGELGQPGMFDEADAEALKAVPRQQRAYLSLEKLESVYTDQLFNLVNDPNPVAVAEDALATGAGTFEAIRGKTTGEPIAPEKQVVTDEAARGYVVRMTFTTPLPPDQARAQFESDQSQNNLQARLFQIAPELKPGLPFAVQIAVVRSIRPIAESPDRLREMQEAYEARRALDPALAGTEGEPPPEQPAPQQRNPRTGFGGARNQGANNQAPASAPAADPGNPAYQDPATGESRLTDTEVVVLFVVQLDPPKPETDTTADDAGQVAGAE
jgi:type IV pilus assembly protein PilM